MNLPNRHAEFSASWSYAKPAIVLHWLLALLLFFMVPLGWYMTSIEDQPGSGWYFNLHKSIGIMVFALVALRLLWRLRHKPENLPSSVPQWRANAASWTQHLLYLCMLILPATGFTGALFSKDGVGFFGVAIAHPAPNHDLSELLFSIHGATVWVLVALVLLHVAGGLKHLVIDRDGVFQRMWPKSSR